ncbi:Tc toxin subunit A [Enterobacter sp. 22466]|uniref:Tc toxin subunit A n=1 Tax=Enterobacter sp. 22466 TaxID=3453924 RepID=UPI003F8292C1
MSNKKKSGVKTNSVLLETLHLENQAAISVLQKQGIRSVMDLVRLPQSTRQGVTSLPELQVLNNLYQRALPLAVTTARQFREKRLVGTVRRVLENRSGIQSLVEGPTYESQFNEPWGAFSLPGAIDSTQGPVAYLTSLYRYLTEELEVMPGSEKEKRIKLLSRRPDIPELLLDESALNKVEPAISIVNRILERAIAQKVEPDPTIHDVDEALSLARYPMNLPFERYMSQILYVTKKGHSSPGDVSRACDPNYPYFVAMGLTSPLAEDAMRMDSQLGPMQQEILIETPYLPGTFSGKRVSPRTGARTETSILNDAFYKRHYGVNNGEVLKDIREFCRRTDTRQEDIESLFSVERYSPVASPNIPGLAPPTPDVFGSVFINSAGNGHAAVSTNDKGDLHKITGVDISHFDRIQRLIRLSRWLELPFDQTDRLLMAAIRIEQQGKEKPEIIPTENTLRSLGLFRRLRKDIGITAEDFAALFEGPARYARGKEVTQFDRIFNRSERYTEPLELDGQDFTIIPRTQEQQARINRLCSAIGIGFETYQYLARFIYQAMNNSGEHQDWDGEEKLAWSYDVVSAFYRLNILPRYLGISAIEAVALLQLLTEQSPQFVNRLAQPRISAGGHSEITDTLNVIQALTDAVLWCQKHQLDVSWLHQTLLPAAPPTEPTLLHNQMVRQITAGSEAVLLTQNGFLQAGLPESQQNGTAISWLGELAVLINGAGIVFEFPSDFSDHVELEIKKIVDRLDFDDPSMVLKATSVILDAKASQDSLVYEAIGNALELTTSQVREMLPWANATVAMVLEHIISMLNPQGEEEPVVSAELIAMLSRIEIRAAVVRKLKLSAHALKLYQEHSQIFERSIFSLPAQANPGVSLNLLFAFVEYQQVIKGAQQPEETIIEYLTLINSLDENVLTPETLALIRDEAAVLIAGFTGLSIRVVIDIAQEINESGLLKTVRDLERLLRVRGLCDNLLLDADAIFSLGKLTPTSSISDFRAAAQKALSCLALADNAVSRRDADEMGQSQTSTIGVDTDTLVANSEDRTIVRVMIRDLMGIPRKNINVLWSTSLGSLSGEEEKGEGVVTEVESVTDDDGIATVWLHPEQIQGAARVVARYGLNSSLTATPVAITYDKNTVKITVVDGYPMPTAANAGALESIEYRALVKDGYENLAMGEQVRWSVDIAAPQFSPLLAVADKNGVARTMLKTLHPEEDAVVVAECSSNGVSVAFAPVVFKDIPWLAKPQMESKLYRNVPHEVTCRAYSIDGQPLAGVIIEWKVIQGEAETITSSVTNEDGIATQRVVPTATGQLQIAVSGKKDEYILPAVKSNVVVVGYLAVTEKRPVEDINLSALPGSNVVELPEFSIKINYEREGVGIIWMIDGEAIDTCPTDFNGRSVFQPGKIEFEGRSELTVTASFKDEVECYFKVNIIEGVMFEFVIPEQDSIAQRDFAEGLYFISVTHKSALKFRAYIPSTGEPVNNIPCKVTLINHNERFFTVSSSIPWDEEILTDDDGLLSMDITPAIQKGNLDGFLCDFSIQVHAGGSVIGTINMAVSVFYERINLWNFSLLYLQPTGHGYGISPTDSWPNSDVKIPVNVSVRTSRNMELVSTYFAFTGNAHGSHAPALLTTPKIPLLLPISGDVVTITYNQFSVNGLPLIFPDGAESMDGIYH